MNFVVFDFNLFVVGFECQQPLSVFNGYRFFDYCLFICLSRYRLLGFDFDRVSGFINLKCFIDCTVIIALARDRNRGSSDIKIILIFGREFGILAVL